jgi:REP element-mobilizing transposase RayT
VGLDTFVVMPDHLHGIVLTGTDPEHEDPAASVGAVVRWFKTAVLTGYRTGVIELGWPRYQKALWQRDYFDRILRSEAEVANRRRYIKGNPGRWWERYGNES